MRLTCPFCGDRDHSEFVYLGDASAERSADETLFGEAVYLRDNPAGEIRELWYHAAGCRRWLKVTRDTRTHVVSAVTLAREDVA